MIKIQVRATDSAGNQVLQGVYEFAAVPRIAEFIEFLGDDHRAFEVTEILHLAHQDGISSEPFFMRMDCKARY